MQRGAVVPIYLQLIGGYKAVDFDEVLACPERAARRARAFRSAAQPAALADHLVQLSEIVKAHLRFSHSLQLAAQVLQQCITHTALRHAPQLLFDRLQPLANWRAQWCRQQRGIDGSAPPPRASQA